MHLYLFGIIITAFFMAASKRFSALVAGFSLQSAFLFLMTLSMAAAHRSFELYAVAALILAFKVLSIPFFLRRVSRTIGAGEDLGLLVNPALSLGVALLLTYLAFLFARNVMALERVATDAVTASLAIMLIGLFLMVCRLKALSQIVGLLVMENGAFLAAVGLCGGMPFIIEITVFFDILMGAIILGIFVYRIKLLFTHIDVDKLTVLKG